MANKEQRYDIKADYLLDEPQSIDMSTHWESFRREGQVWMIRFDNPMVTGVCKPLEDIDLSKLDPATVNPRAVQAIADMLAKNRPKLSSRGTP
ncbi:MULTISPECIES: hypothetical protein [Pseudomonas]|uniref:Uncharacterized protein n=1 Tax=Pseudomonas fluorescens TaxID=294 RepID=A0A166QPE3_PSEFL|nr:MULTISPECIES: hypothetical protein [Pseudomonas]KZN20639.1 hypothetical protein A1D17_03615 [Pseudomonas fluorescens]